MNAFWLGIASGLAGSLLLWLFRGMIGVLPSMLQRQFAKGRNLSGRWNAKYETSGGIFREEADLNLLFRWVWGTTYNTKRDRRYKIKGTLVDEVLVATYELHSAEHYIDRGSFILMQSVNGDIMTGHYSWVDVDASASRSGRYVWWRPSAIEPSFTDETIKHVQPPPQQIP